MKVTTKVMTANRLGDGAVVYLADDNDWVLALDDAEVADGEEAAAALEARTGEPVWIRRLAPEETYAGNYNEPWRQSAPIVLDDRVIALAPDRMTLDVYDRTTGERLAHREASELGWPDYLLGVGELVVGVGADLAVLPAMEVDSAEPAMIALPVDAADGRVRAAGRRLLVPTERGVRLSSRLGSLFR